MKQEALHVPAVVQGVLNGSLHYLQLARVPVAMTSQMLTFHWHLRPSRHSMPLKRTATQVVVSAGAGLIFRPVHHRDHCYL